jgi:hypothetical protein
MNTIKLVKKSIKSIKYIGHYHEIAIWKIEPVSCHVQCIAGLTSIGSRTHGN